MSHSTAVMPAATEAGSSTAVRAAMLQDVFSAFDLDNDGFVDSKELMQLGAARQVSIGCCFP